jgi:hypothetical protein
VISEARIGEIVKIGEIVGAEKLGVGGVGGEAADELGDEPLTAADTASLVDVGAAAGR